MSKMGTVLMKVEMRQLDRERKIEKEGPLQVREGGRRL